MTKVLRWTTLALLVAIAGCSDDNTGPRDRRQDDAGGVPADASRDADAPDATADGGDAAVDVVGADAEPVPEIELPDLQKVSADGFATSLNCADCHSNSPQSNAMRDQSGEAIGFYDLWKATMMANASRDPLWRAVVSAETAATPSASEAIEDKCMNCHAPMAYSAAHEAGELARLATLHQSTPRAMLGLDGASCTTCHKIEPDNFGQPDSFSGGFELNPAQIAYGPLASPFAMPMLTQSGFEPLVGEHVLESAMCATCHNLHTDTLDAQGNPVGTTFIEQSPYTEWQNSVYNTDGGAQPASCQSCHMPQKDDQDRTINTAIARRPNGGDFPAVQPRQPVGRHVLVGGNTLLPAILRDNAEALAPLATAGEFDALIARVRDQLQQRTARVTIATAQKTNVGVGVEVVIENLTGHKFPTSFPSRRAWLHVTLRDSQGNVVFESGRYNDDGQIVGPDGGVLAIEKRGGPIEAHHDAIGDDQQVQIYEPVMADADGEPTYVLMRAASYYKDNRLLPEGWSSSFGDIDQIAPVGTAQDSDFVGGEDRVLYNVPIQDTTGSFQVDVELVYQTVGARFAAELFAVDTQSMQVFEQYWNAADTAPELVGSATATVP